MRALATIALVIYVTTMLATALPTGERYAPLQESQLADKWKEFLTQFRPEGYPTGDEFLLRFEAFALNWKNAVAASVANPYATFGIHPRSDWTAAELARLRGHKGHVDKNGKPAPHVVNPKRIQEIREAYAPMAAKARVATPIHNPKNLTEPGTEISWVTNGKVTNVKDQGQCSCCWAFAAIANAESLNAIGGKGLVSLSEQEIVSCYEGSCNAGYVQNAWYYLIHQRNGGIASYSQFPYQSGNLAIPTCPALTPVQYIASYENLYSGEVNLYYDVWNIGPIAVCLATSTAWDSYTGGVMTDCPQAASDHCVTVVGYNTGANPPFWIIKNSWGTAWGSSGYLYLQYGQDLCSLANYPTTSLL